MKIAVRGYGEGRLLFEEIVEAEATDDFAAIAISQIERVNAYRRNMIEIEFLEETNPNERFYHFGTDPAGMALPVKVKGGLDGRQN